MVKREENNRFPRRASFEPSCHVDSADESHEKKQRKYKNEEEEGEEEEEGAEILPSSIDCLFPFPTHLSTFF